MAVMQLWNTPQIIRADSGAFVGMRTAVVRFKPLEILMIVPTVVTGDVLT